MKLTTTHKALLWGFLFGTAGLYILAILSLVVPFFEYISSPLMAPGRSLAGLISPDGSGTNSDVAILTLANGVLYAIVFLLVRLAFRRRRKDTASSIPVEKQ